MDKVFGENPGLDGERRDAEAARQGFDSVPDISTFVSDGAKQVSDAETISKAIELVSSSRELQETIKRPASLPLALRYLIGLGERFTQTLNGSAPFDAEADQRFLDAVLNDRFAQELLSTVWDKNATGTQDLIGATEKASLEVLKLLHERINSSVKETLMYLGEPNPSVRANLSHAAFWLIALSGQMGNFMTGLNDFWLRRMRRGFEVGPLIPDQRLLSEAASFPVEVRLADQDSEFLESISDRETREAIVVGEQIRTQFNSLDASVASLECTFIALNKDGSKGGVVKATMQRSWFTQSGSMGSQITETTFESLVALLKQSRLAEKTLSRGSIQKIKTSCYGDYWQNKKNPLVSRLFDAKVGTEHLAFVLEDPDQIGTQGMSDLCESPWFLTGGDGTDQTIWLQKKLDSLMIKSAHRYNDGMPVIKGVDDSDPNQNPFLGFKAKYGEAVKLVQGKVENRTLQKPIAYRSVDFPNLKPEAFPPSLPLEIFSEAKISQGEYARLAKLVSQVRELYSASEVGAKSVSLADLTQFAFHLLGAEAGQMVVQQKDSKDSDVSRLSVAFSVMPERLKRGKEILKNSMTESEQNDFVPDLLEGMRLFIREKKWAVEGKGTSPFFTTLGGQKLDSLFEFVGKFTAGKKFATALAHQAFMLSFVALGTGPRVRAGDKPSVVNFASAQSATLAGTPETSGMGAVGMVDMLEGGLRLTARTVLDQAWDSISSVVDGYFPDAQDRDFCKQALMEVIFVNKKDLALGTIRKETWDALMIAIAQRIKHDRQEQLAKVFELLPRLCGVLIDYAHRHGATEKQGEVPANKLNLQGKLLHELPIIVRPDHQQKESFLLRMLRRKR